MVFTQEGLICPVCRGFVFRESDNGDLICTQCGTISEQSHKATVEEDVTAIQKDRFGVSVRRILPSQRKEKRRKKKDKVLSLQHLLYIVQKILIKQVQSVKPYIPCPEEYDTLCKSIWLRLVLKSKPYLSTFTHIYPYTMTRIKPPSGMSIPGTPSLEKGSKSPPPELDGRLFPDSQSSQEKQSQPLDSSQLIASLQNTQSNSPLSPQSPKIADSSQMVFSGMELPESLRSFLSQTQPSMVKKRIQPDSPKRKGRVSPKRSRKNSLTSAVVKPSTIMHWDDDELVLYGREKVYSFSGYKLQMGSLLGVLYLTSRILQLPLFPRDFELLAALDGVIPYINIMQYLDTEDVRQYVRPIKHWFTKIVIPNAFQIESEAWIICHEIGISYPSLPLLPTIQRIGMILQFPKEVTILVEKILRKDESVLIEEEEDSDSPILLFHELSEEEWEKRRIAFANASISRLCEKSIVYCAALFILSTFILQMESFVQFLDSHKKRFNDNGFGMMANTHIPPVTHCMGNCVRCELSSIIQKIENILNPSSAISQETVTAVSNSEEGISGVSSVSYPIFYGLKFYQYSQLSETQQQLVSYVSKNMEVSITILLAHVRSVEYLLRSKEESIIARKKEDLLECYL